MSKDTGTEMLDFFCRHLVSVTVRCENGSGQQTADAFTTFALDVNGTWFLATAGHIIKKMEAIEAMWRVHEWSLFDGWSPKSDGQPQVPFNLEDAIRSAVDEDDIDLGALRVPDLLRRTLAANGIQALGERTWRQLPETFDACFMLGLPSELIEAVHAGHEVSHMKVEPAIIRIVPCAPPSEGMTVSPVRFYGRVAPELRDQSGETLRNLDGMSGGDQSSALSGCPTAGPDTS